MSEVTRILFAIEQGDPHAAEQLLPLVYDELRKLASQRMGQEKPGQTLQATALVHEAYLRLVGQAPDKHWDHRGHFFAAAAEAMRRILVERARRKQSRKRGGGISHQDTNLEDLARPDTLDPLEVLTVHEALDQLAEKSPRKAELVKLRYFLGCTMAEAAQILGIAQATTEEDWTYAKAWLRRKWLRGDEKKVPDRKK
jgi:RNA polymerase sigma factor (TIGR02999 family)